MSDTLPGACLTRCLVHLARLGLVCVGAPGNQVHDRGGKGKSLAGVPDMGKCT